MIVTAGNPPEYNNSVREFDIVTWDRLKRIDVEPDYSVWKEYAYKSGIHASIITYLDIKKADFYKIETTVDGKSFVTARGWSDLSDMINLYEQNGITVNEKLISQYLQNKKVAKDFAIYYDLFNKYKSDYQVDKILDGKAGTDIEARAKGSRFDERLSLLGLILDAITAELKDIYNTEMAMTELLSTLKNVRITLVHPDANAIEVLEMQIEKLRSVVETGKHSSAIAEDKQYAMLRAASILEEIREKMINEPPENGTEAFKKIKAEFDKKTKELKKLAENAGKKLSNVFAFCESAFDEGQEILILVTELTINYYSARFISRYGCKEYFSHNKELLFYERQKEIITELENLELD